MSDVEAVVTKKIKIGRLSAYQTDANKDAVRIHIEAEDYADESSQEVVLTAAAARHFGAMIADLFEEPES